MYVYTIGVKRRFLPGFRKYRVLGHSLDVQPGLIRMVLTLADGAYLVLPRLDRLGVKIYPDYRTAKSLAEADEAKKAPPPPPAEG